MHKVSTYSTAPGKPETEMQTDWFAQIRVVRLVLSYKMVYLETECYLDRNVVKHSDNKSFVTEVYLKKPS